MKKFQYDYPHPAVTVDIVVFAMREGRLVVLLIRRALEPFAGKMAIPGGFVLENETVEEAAFRELREETGVGGVDLHFVGIYSKPDRDPRERVISVAYLAAVQIDSTLLQAGTDAADAHWCEVDDPPALAFDHPAILGDAVNCLRAIALHTQVVLRMIPEPFTLSDLQTAVETVLGKPLDKRNFRRQMLETGWLIETAEQAKGSHRPAKLYRRTITQRPVD